MIFLTVFKIHYIIIKQFDVMKKLNVLIITPAPTETSPQFTNDLFNKFKDFDKFKIHHIEGSKNLIRLNLVITTYLLYLNNYCKNI